MLGFRSCAIPLCTYRRGTLYRVSYQVPGTGTQAMYLLRTVLNHQKKKALPAQLNSASSAAQRTPVRCGAVPCPEVWCCAMLRRAALCCAVLFRTYSSTRYHAKYRIPITGMYPVAPVAYQVILEPGIGQFREFESPQVHTRINSWGLFSCAQIDLRKARERELATLDQKSTSSGIAEPYAR